MRHLFAVASRYHKKLSQQQDEFGPDSSETIPAPPHPGVSQEINMPESDPPPSFEEEEDQPDTIRESISLRLDRQSVDTLIAALDEASQALQDGVVSALKWRDLEFDKEKTKQTLNHVLALKSYLKQTLQK